MKKTIYAGLVVAVLIAGGLVAYYGSLNDNDGDNDNTSQQESSTQSAEDQATTANIEFSEDGKTVTYSGEEGKDALTILKENTSVETESSDFGEFVTTINDVKADSKTEFWAFYVNGKLANKGAGSYQTKDGDSIKWHLDKLE